MGSVADKRCLVVLESLSYPPVGVPKRLLVETPRHLVVVVEELYLAVVVEKLYLAAVVEEHYLVALVEDLPLVAVVE